jgi:hypothetical protein
MLLLTRIEEESLIDGIGNLAISRAMLAGRVRNTANLPGASGPISFEVSGDRVNQYVTTVWADQFADLSLDSAWSWISEDPTHWSLSARPGFLRIITQQAGNNRLVRDAPLRDFEIRTCELFNPTQNFQMAGLYVYGDASNYLVLGRAYCDPGFPVCVGNGIYFDHVEGGVGIGSNYAMTTGVHGEACLRIVGNGSEFTGYVSKDGTGTEWTQVGTHTLGFTPTKIGLIASNQNQLAGEMPADFDFFVLQYYSAYKVYLPMIARAWGP